MQEKEMYPIAVESAGAIGNSLYKWAKQVSIEDGIIRIPEKAARHNALGETDLATAIHADLTALLVAFNTTSYTGNQFQAAMEAVKEIAKASSPRGNALKTEIWRPYQGSLPFMCLYPAEVQSEISMIISASQRKKECNPVDLPYPVFHAHIDTLPSIPIWSTRDAYYDSNQQVMLGRGTADMKASLASILVANALLANLSANKHIVLITSDEEVGGAFGGEEIAWLFNSRKAFIDTEPSPQDTGWWRRIGGATRMQLPLIPENKVTELTEKLQWWSYQTGICTTLSQDIQNTYLHFPEKVDNEGKGDPQLRETLLALAGGLIGTNNLGFFEENEMCSHVPEQTAMAIDKAVSAHMKLVDVPEASLPLSQLSRSYRLNGDHPHSSEIVVEHNFSTILMKQEPAHTVGTPYVNISMLDAAGGRHSREEGYLPHQGPGHALAIAQAVYNLNRL